MDPFTQVTMLHNGVRIATEEVESPLACLSLFVTVGSRYETACTNGLSHFIEHLAFKGFRTLNKCGVEESIMCMGGKLTAQTTREMQIFSAILPSEYAPSAVDKLSKIIIDLDLNDCEVEQERFNINSELIDADNDPKQLVFDYLHATAFQGTPLGQRVIGSSSNIERFDACAASNFMCEHYQPYRLILATSGNVTHEKIMQYAEGRFGCIAPQPCCEPEPGPSRFTGSTVVYRDDSMPLCHAAIAFEAPGYCSPSYLTMLVMKYIVGSWDRSQGLGEGNAPMVARAFATDKLCEMYESFYITYRDIGLWGVYFVADKWKLDEVVYHFQFQWMQLCTMVQMSEIERGFNGVRMELARRYDSVVSSSHDIGTQMLYTCGRKSLAEVTSGLDRIKVHNVRELSDKYLYDRCPAVVAVGPTETMPDYVRIRSGQWWLRL